MSAAESEDVDARRKGGYVRQNGRVLGRVKHAASKINRLLSGDSNR